MTADATVEISIDNAIQPSRADFFKFLILETVNDGGSCGCLSLNCSFKLFFNVLSLTNSITELIIGPKIKGKYFYYFLQNVSVSDNYNTTIN